MASWLADPNAHDTFRDILNHYAANRASCALTASIADALVDPADGPAEVVACWWIASKFEDVAPLDGESLAFQFLPLTRSKEQLIALETKVLARVQCTIPYKTIVREMYNAVTPEQVRLLSHFCYALLDGGLFDRCPDTTADEWLEQMTRLGADLTPEMHNLCEPAFCERLRKAIEFKNAGAVVPKTSSKRPRGDGTTPDSVIDLTSSSPLPPPPPPRKAKVVIDLCTPPSTK